MTKTYQPTWESLVQHELPGWFSEGKFGLYAHWGIYSVPGFGNEWYGKWMNDPAHEIHRRHIEQFASPADYGYTKFIKGFTAEHFDPDEWAELFAASGARYAGFSLAHHDGFGLWDSDVYRWNVGKMGPKRDLYGELAAALRARDLRLVAPFHIIRGFNWFLAGWNQWDQTFDADAVERGMAEGWELFDPDFADFYWVQQTSKFEDFFEQWQLKVREVIDKYQPDMMWFDGGKFRDEGQRAYRGHSGCPGGYYQRLFWRNHRPGHPKGFGRADGLPPNYPGFGDYGRHGRIIPGEYYYRLDNYPDTRRRSDYPLPCPEPQRDGLCAGGQVRGL